MLNNPTFQINSSNGLSLGVYCSIIHTYPTPPIYVLHSLQGQFIGFQDFTLLLNSKRVSHSYISDGSISQIFGLRYDMLSKPLRTVLFLGILRWLAWLILNWFLRTNFFDNLVVLIKLCKIRYIN